MSEQLTIHHERVDDIPLLFSELQRLKLAKLLDECFPTHANWSGLGLGEVLSVWLVFILSEANHRMSHLEPWAKARLRTIAACLPEDGGGTEEEEEEEEEVRALDFSDDRLARVLDYLSEDGAWWEFERRLNEHTLRVYDLRPKRVRVDATTAKYHGRVSDDGDEEGLFRFGHSKDRRPDLAQLKINLAVLDPLGMPFSSTVVGGDRADDPLYVPEIRRVQEQDRLGSGEEGGLTFIGDAKMAALSTRAFVAAGNDYYLCPLPATQVAPEEMERLLTPVWERRQALDAVFRPLERGAAPTTTEEEEEEEELIAEGYEFEVAMEATTTPEGRRVRWPERRLVVRSVAYAEAQNRALEKRLEKARTDIASLNERRQGKKVFSEEAEMLAAGERIVSRHRVEGVAAFGVREERRGA